jgi:hypothetical protein
VSNSDIASNVGTSHDANNLDDEVDSPMGSREQGPVAS